MIDAARSADAVVMTKDRDFAELVERHGTPPHVVWVTSGNTSDERLRVPEAIGLLAAGQPLVEIT